MGSMPRLPKKIELKYRKGSTAEHLNCQHCVNLVKRFKTSPNTDEPRCRIFGLRESIRYRVREDHRCNAWVLDETSCPWLKERKA
jgi:hypothetical protein